MCAVGISLHRLRRPRRAASAGDVAVALVDRAGASLGGDPEATRVLPVAVAGRRARSSAARRRSATTARTARSTISASCRSPSNSIFVVAAAPVAEGFAALLVDWGGFAAGRAGARRCASLAVWLGADRWCVRPLRYIQDFADRVARGDDMTLAPQRSMGARNWPRSATASARWPPRSPAARPS